MKKRIFDDGKIRATWHRPDEIKSPGVICITFQEVKGRLSDTGFGTEFLAKNGIESIYFSHHGQSFYQALDLDLFKRIVSKHTDGKRVCLYGASLGGYAAIYFSGCVQGQAIALSPRCSADPILSQGKELAPFRHIFLNEMPADLISNKNPIIAYDPLRADDTTFLRTRVLLAYPNSSLLEIPNGQNTIAKTLQNSGVLKEFVLGAILSGKVSDALQVDPETNPIYTFRLANSALIEGNVADLNAYIEKCIRWGGDYQLISLVHKAAKQRLLKIGLTGSEIPLALRKTYIRKKVKSGHMDLDNMSLESMADLQLRFLEFDSALSLLYAASIQPEANKVRIKKRVNRVNALKAYMESLPQYKG